METTVNSSQSLRSRVTPFGQQAPRREVLSNTLAINKLALNLPNYIVNETHKEFIICVFVKKYIMKRLSEVTNLQYFASQSKVSNPSDSVTFFPEGRDYLYTSNMPQEDHIYPETNTFLQTFVCDLIPNWTATDDIRCIFSISKPFERNYKTINKRTLDEYIANLEDNVPKPKPSLFEDIIIEIDKPDPIMNQEVTIESTESIEADDIFYDSPNKFDEYKKKLEDFFKKDKMNGNIPSFSQKRSCNEISNSIWEKPTVQEQSTLDLIKSNLKLSELNEKTQTMYLTLKKENEEMIDYNIKMSIDNTRVIQDNERLVNEASDLTNKNEDYKLNKKHLCDYINTLETKNVKLLTELIVTKNKVSKLERTIQQNEIAFDRKEYKVLKNERKMTRKIISLKRSIKSLKNTKNILIDNVNQRKVVEMATQTEPQKGLIVTFTSGTDILVTSETCVQEVTETEVPEVTVTPISTERGVEENKIEDEVVVKQLTPEDLDNTEPRDIIEPQDTTMSEVTVSDKADSIQDMDWGWSDDDMN